jgi:thioredoxin reductase (NADPH)
MGELRPMLVAFDEEPAAREAVHQELTQRYGHDYDVLVAPIHEASSDLQRLADDGRDVMIVLAGANSHEDAVAVLADTRRWFPASKRCLVLDWGDRSAADVLLRASAAGDLHYWVPRPWARPDESFHQVISEFLGDWSRTHRPPYEVVRLVGQSWDPVTYDLRDMLGRNGVPFGFIEAGTVEADALLTAAGVGDGRLPVAVLFDGRVLVQPTGAEIGAAFGIATSAPEGVFDVAIVGAGPAGLAAAVYAASEGLRTACIEHQAIGGQAGTSSLIRNYLGFPRGVGGADLAQRAYEQAWLFGTEFVYSSAVGLDLATGTRSLALEDGSSLVARSVVIATGMSYRMLEAPGLDRLRGAGVYYGAASSEAAAIAGQDVAVVGGGNSAGQAASFLASHARRVTLLVRDATLADSMSEYLVRTLATTPNIEVRFGAEVVGAEGDARLDALVVREGSSAEGERLPVVAAFILIGAEPRTAWLPAEVARDRWGSILTGTDVGDGGVRPRLASSVPGVFAVGDVRHGSVKRVASAVGEGSVAIGAAHEFLAEAR